MISELYSVHTHCYLVLHCKNSQWNVFYLRYHQIKQSRTNQRGVSKHVMGMTLSNYILKKNPHILKSLSVYVQFSISIYVYLLYSMFLYNEKLGLVMVFHQICHDDHKSFISKQKVMNKVKKNDYFYAFGSLV